MNVESIRSHIEAAHSAGPVTAPAVPPGSTGTRHLIEMGRIQSLALLAGVSLGRVVFTQQALPTLRPVNHALLDDEIIIRTHSGAALASYVGRSGDRGAVVAYEAEKIDPDTHLGWSVIVTGYARLVADQVRLARYLAAPAPWIDHTMDCVVCVSLDLVSGFRLAA